MVLRRQCRCRYRATEKIHASPPGERPHGPPGGARCGISERCRSGFEKSARHEPLAIRRAGSGVVKVTPRRFPRWERPQIRQRLPPARSERHWLSGSSRGRGGAHVGQQVVDQRVHAAGALDAVVRSFRRPFASSRPAYLRLQKLAIDRTIRNGSLKSWLAEKANCSRSALATPAPRWSAAWLPRSACAP